MKTTLDFLTSRTPRARLIALAVVAGVAILIILVLHATGAAPGLRYAHDDFLYLDAGWRVLAGQRPHVDFHTPMGAFTPLLFGLAMKIGGATAASFGVAVPLVVAVLTAWAWLVAAPRLSAALAAAYALLVATLAGGQHALGFDYTDVSYASLVDRFAWAVVALVLVECLVPPAGDDSRAVRVGGGCSTGAALALLFFLKPSYLVPALVFVTLSTAYRRTDRARWGALGGTAAGVLALFFLAARTTPGAVLADYADGIIARQAALSTGRGNLFMDLMRRESFAASPDKLLEIVRTDAWSFLALLGVAGAATVPVPRVEARYAGRRWLVALAVAVFAFSLPVCATNWQWGEIPLLAAAGVVLAEPSLRAGASVGDAALAPSALPRAMAVAALVAFLVGSVVLKNAGSTLAAWSLGDSYRLRLKKDLRLKADPVKSLIVVRSDGGCEPLRYAEKVDDGLDLLTKEGGAHPVVLVTDYSDPFTFSLHATPATGGELWWHYGTTFSADNPPPVADVLRDVNIVMVPKCPEDQPTRDVMLDLYRSVLDRDFEEGASSEAWLLLRKKGP